MRGITAKKLRRIARLQHALLAVTGTIAPPESQEELDHARRKLYLVLKDRWKSISNPKSIDSELRSMRQRMILKTGSELSTS